MYIVELLHSKSSCCLEIKVFEFVSKLRLTQIKNKKAINEIVFEIRMCCKL